jgi:hypothetical protein
MDFYHIWCNLKDSSKDLDFCQAVDAYLGYLQKQGKIKSFSVT